MTDAFASVSTDPTLRSGPMQSSDRNVSENDFGRSGGGAENRFTPYKGINSAVVEQVSAWKHEPEWMRALRLRSLRVFDETPFTGWFAANMSDFAVQELYDWSRSPGEQRSEMDDLRDLAGDAARHESEDVDHKVREELEAQGVRFCDMDTALQEFPHLVQEHFGTVVPPGENKFAALNTAVWSGGSFIYVPPGVEVEMPLQTNVRITSEHAGQFERTLIVADEGSRLHYIEGCSAPVYTKNSLHSAVAEIIVKPGARVTYTAIQNWSPNVYNLVTKRARVEAHGSMDWTEGNIGSKLTMAYPAVHLVGEGATGQVLSVAYAGEGQHQDTDARIVHAAPHTTSKIVSKSISKDGGVTTCRGLVHVEEGASHSTSHVECDALILDDRSASTTEPGVEVGERDAQVGREATVSKISAGQLFYLMSRGLSEEQAMGMIVNGFIEPITRTLPIEFAVEWSRLIELQMEGSVG